MTTREGRRALLATSALWLQRMERKEADRKAAIHPPESGAAGLVERREDWESAPPRATAARGGGPVWSSYRHYLTGQPGIVEIESQWTARARERLGRGRK